jgi:hypothetical protein
MKLLDRLKRLRPLQKILIIIVILAVGIVSWNVYDTVRPRPLGEGMVYLGKEDYGNIFGFDSLPYSVYYYGTDMDEAAMSEYFTANYSPLEGLAYRNARFTATEGVFAFTYDNRATYATKKKYVVSIVNEQYEIAKKYIKQNSP